MEFILFLVLIQNAAFAGSEFSFTGPVKVPGKAPVVPSTPPLPRPRNVQDSVGRLSSAFGACNCVVWGVDTVMTNDHCLWDSKTRQYGSSFDLQFTDKDGKPYSLTCTKILAKNPGLDYAILDCPRVGTKVPKVEPCTEPVKTGDTMTLATYDYHKGVQLRVENGRYSGAQMILQEHPRTKEKTFTSAYTLTGLQVYKGNSGSPTFSDKKCMNGLVYAQAINEDTKKIIPGLNFVTPLSEIRQDLRTKAPGLAMMLAINRVPAAATELEDLPDPRVILPPEPPRPLEPGESAAYTWNEITKQWEFSNFVRAIPPARPKPAR